MADERTTVSEFFGAHAAPLTISLGEKVFRFSPITQELKTRWERFLREDYRREALETTGRAETADLLTTQAGARKCFRWLSDWSNAIAATSDGALMLTMLVLGCTEAEAVELDRVSGSELGSKLTQVIAESIPPHRRKKTEAAPEANGSPTEAPGPTPLTPPIPRMS